MGFSGCTALETLALEFSTYAHERQIRTHVDAVRMCIPAMLARLPRRTLRRIILRFDTHATTDVFRELELRFLEQHLVRFPSLEKIEFVTYKSSIRVFREDVAEALPSFGHMLEFAVFGDLVDTMRQDCIMDWATGKP